jgi:cytochrome c
VPLPHPYWLRLTSIIPPFHSLCHMNPMRIILPAALLLLAAPALAQENASSIAQGRKLAEINCTRCHNIEAMGESPLADAPPFREISKNYDRMELIDGFMEGLAVRHPLMPDWEVTEPQAEALTDFVMSLGSGEAKGGNSPAVAGHDILRANCARCHAIDMKGSSPEPKAPPFREVVKKYDPSALEEALAEGIVTGHEKMPQFQFAPEQIAAIVSYLSTLQPD